MTSLSYFQNLPAGHAPDSLAWRICGMHVACSSIMTITANCIKFEPPSLQIQDVLLHATEETKFCTQRWRNLRQVKMFQEGVTF